MKQELRHTSPFLKAVVGRGLLTSSRAPTIQSRRGYQLWRVKRERAPIAVNRLGCTTSSERRSVVLRSHRLELSFVCGYFHASFPHRHWMKQELRHTSPFLKAVVGRGLLTSSRAPTIQSRRGYQLWRVKRERAPIAVNRLGCTTSSERRSVVLRSHRLELSFVCGYFHASFPHRHWMKQELRHTSPFLKAVVGRDLLTSSRAPTIQSRRGHQLWRVKRSALRLRLTGSTAQPMSYYDLLTYKAIGSNYLSFVVTSMLVFHIATGWSRNCDTVIRVKLTLID